ncbi:Calx-beta domain-containing protein [Actinoplanes sp. NPDC049802]|uniref:Calx-beta domain-containing protein n=1 Tax=Actinoplanes sp. NPDC049802 TaxID=3154742 RepID=UPI0033EEC202
MRERPAHRAAEEIPFRLWAPGRLHAFVSVAAATAVGLLPGVAYAAPGQEETGPVVNIGAPVRETVAEGDVLVFPVTLVDGTGPVTVQFSITDISTASDDRLPVDPVIIDPDVSPTVDVEVATVADVTSEAQAETFSLQVDDTEEVTPGTAGVGRILDPVLSITPSGTIPEGDGDHEQTFDVSLNVGFAGGLDLDYTAWAAENDSAVDGTHFDATTASLNIPADETSAQFDVTIHGDQRHGGPDKTFSLDLVNFGKPNVVWPGPRTITIDDDENLPAIASVTAEPLAAEGDGPTMVTYEVRLTEASTQDITLAVSGDGGEAEQTGDRLGSNDYSVPSDVVFQAGETVQTFDVTVHGDGVFEKDETATIAVTPPSDGTIIDPVAKTAPLIIPNDDAAPTITFNNFDQYEDSPDVPVTFNVSGQFQGPLNWTASALGTETDDLDAAEGGDFNALDLDLDGELQSADTEIVLGKVDLLLGSADEFDEAIEFTVDLEDVGPVSGHGVIRDSLDHLEPKLEMVADAEFMEHEEAASLPVRVWFDPADGNQATSSEKPISVNYSTGDGTALADDDYTAVAEEPVTVSDEEPFTELPLTLTADGTREVDEWFTVSLSDPPVNATLAPRSSTTVTITEAPPTVAVADAPAVAEGEPLRFPVTLSDPLGNPVTVGVITSDGSAESGSDYTAVTEVEIPANTRTAFVEVPTKPDDLPEADPETVTVKIIAPEGLTLGADTATGKIVDAELTVTPDGPITEGDSGTREQTFTVSSNVAFTNDVEITYDVVANTATDADFTAVDPGPLLITAGQTEAQFTVTIVGDQVPEAEETFTVRLTGITGTPATVAGLTEHAFGIVDDEQVPTITSVTGPDPLAEGSGPTTVTYTVTLDRPAPAPITLAVGGDDDSAVQIDDGVGGQDYTVPDTVTIDQDESSATFDVTINGDTIHEEDESAVIVVNPQPNDATVRGTGQAPLNITDDDTAPTLDFTEFDEIEGATGVAVKFQVIGSAQASHDWTATIESNSDDTTDSTQEPDFTKGALKLDGTIAPGATEVSLGAIDLVTGSADEYDDTVTATVEAGALGTFTGQGRIRDLPTQKAPLIVPEGDVTVGEGEEATVFFGTDFAAVDGNTATRTEKQIEADFRTVGVSATEGTDYEAASGSVFVEPGDAGGYAQVLTTADGVPESDETLRIELINLGESPYDGPAPIVTIKDVERNVSVGDADTVGEGAKLRFPVTLTAPGQAPITVKVATSTGTATADTDYTAFTEKEVVFAPGETAKTVEVATIADGAAEDAEETVVLRITDTGGTAAGTTTATGRIVDPVLSVSRYEAIMEGDDGTREAYIDVRLNARLDTEVRLEYDVVGDTATAGTDFDAVSRRSMVFEPGQTFGNITVPIHGDHTDEGAGETFKVRLFNVVGAPVEGSNEHTFTIVDDDGAPALAGLEAPDGIQDGEQDTTSKRVYYVQLSGPVAEPVTLNVRAIDGTAVQSGSGPGRPDFSVPGTVTVNQGQSSAIIEVTLVGDDVHEATETATLAVAPRPGETAVVGSEVTTQISIDDDDAPPTVTVVPFDRDESAGIVLLRANVTGAAQAPIPWTATVAGVSDGNSDPAESDDLSMTGLTRSGTIAPGETQIDLGSVELFVGAADEFDETVKISLTAEGLAPADGWGKIRDLDTHLPPVLASPADVAVVEGATATIPVELDFGAVIGNTATSTEKTVKVDYGTVPGTATAGSDYTAVSNGVTFTPGTTTDDITVTTLTDAVIDPGETFTVVQANEANTVPGAGSLTTTVTINEAPGAFVPPTFQVQPDTTATEGQATPAGVTVTLSAPAPEDVDLVITTTDGTARAGGDFTAPPGTLTIPQGQQSATVKVPIVDDAVHETKQTATIKVGLAPGETQATGVAQESTLVITDDDPVPTITLNTANGPEGATVDVIATPTGVAEDPITYLLSLSGDSSNGADPAESTDFTDNSGEVILPGGSTAPVTLKTITLKSDAIDEAIETIRAILQNLTVPETAPVTSRYGITDDAQDLPPTVAVGSVQVSENAGGVDLPVSLEFQSGNSATSTEQPIAVAFETQAGTANASDFGYSATTNPLVIPAGAAGGTIRMPVTDDTEYEPTEGFLVRVAPISPTDVKVSPDLGIVYIIDDDQASRPTFTAEDTLHVGEESGSATIAINLSAAAPRDIDLTVAVQDGTATEGGSGTGEDDFDKPATTTVRIPQGARSTTVTVPIRSDNVYEGEEKALVTVALAPGELDAVGPGRDTTLVIADDDPEPTFTLSPATVVEGDTVRVSAVVTGTAQRPMTFDEPIVTGGGDEDAAEAADYEADLTAELPAGTASGSTIELGTVRVNGDTVDEATEGFTVAFGGSVAGFRITDDPADTPPTVSITDVTADESDDTATVTATLEFSGDTTATERTITIPWRTVDGTAKAGKDYTAATGTITIDPLENSATVAVPLRGDTQFEQDQAFIVRLGEASPADVKVEKANGEVTVEDDDKPKAPTLSAPANVTGVGRVTISGTAGAGSTVELLSAPGTSGGTFKVVSTVQADSEGAYSFKPNFTQGYRLQVRADKLTSAVRTVQVRQEPKVTVTSPSRRTARITVTGDPDRKGQNVTVQRQDRGGWDTVAAGRLDGDGEFVTTERSLRSGSNAVYRAVIAATPSLGILAGTSPARTIRVK